MQRKNTDRECRINRHNCKSRTNYVCFFFGISLFGTHTKSHLRIIFTAAIHTFVFCIISTLMASELPAASCIKILPVLNQQFHSLLLLNNCCWSFLYLLFLLLFFIIKIVRKIVCLPHLQCARRLIGDQRVLHWQRAQQQLHMSKGVNADGAIRQRQFAALMPTTVLANNLVITGRKKEMKEKIVQKNFKKFKILIKN